MSEPELPRDAVVLKELLQSMGVADYEPRVLNQLMDFMYRYITEVLQDAHAHNRSTIHGKGEVSLDDILLAMQAREAFSFAQPPPQDVLSAIADQRNKVPLPPLSQRYGLRLPPEEDCLMAPHYQLLPAGSTGRLGTDEPDDDQASNAPLSTMRRGTDKKHTSIAINLHSQGAEPAGDARTQAGAI